MKKKKLLKKYNQLAMRYNKRVEEIESLLRVQNEMETALSATRFDKEDITCAFLSMKEQYENLLRQTKEIKHERDVYRQNYGELVSIAVNANEGTNDAISIKSIDFSDDVTTITWSDGATTSVKRMKGEKHDTHTAVAYAIAKRVLGTTSIADVVEYYQEDHSKDAKYLRIYNYLNSNNPIKRVKAQKAWEKIPEAKRQSIKSMAKSIR